MVLEQALEHWNPLDLRRLFIDEIIGFDEQGIIVFMVLGILVIGYLCAKFRCPNIVTIMLVVCFLFIMGGEASAFVTIAVLIVGLIVSWIYSKYIGRM